jgi:hypothetical protein
MHVCITAAASPHHRLEPAVTALPAMRDRVPWRSTGTGVASLVTPVSIGILHPVLGEVLAVIEVVVVLTIIGTALFGSLALSERAFRLLRWIGNRPEPPVPAPPHLGNGGADVAGTPLYGQRHAH